MHQFTEISGNIRTYMPMFNKYSLFYKLHTSDTCFIGVASINRQVVNAFKGY